MRENNDRGLTSTAVDRRRFIGLTGAALAAQWLPTSFGNSPALAESPQGRSLMPGYLRASHLIASHEDVLEDLCNPTIPFYDTLRHAIPEDLPLDIMPAEVAPTVENAFPQDLARIWIHGLLPPDRLRADRALASADLVVEVQPDPALPSHEHFAWAYKEGPVANLSGPTQFVVPVDEGAAVRFKLELTRMAAANAKSGPLMSSEADRDNAPIAETLNYLTEFSSTDRYGQPNLRPGLYVLPLSDAAERAIPQPANREYLVDDSLLYLMFSVQPVMS